MSKVEPYFDEIIELVASGLSIERALRSRPEFPVKETWRSFVRDSRFPDRRHRLDAAKAEGKGKRGYKFQFYTEADFDRSLNLIRDNFPTSMTQLKFDGCPGYTGLWQRSKSDPEFAKRFAAAREGRARGGREPIYNDGNVMEAIAVLKQEGVTAYKQRRPDGLPSYDVLWDRSRRDPEFAKIFSNAVETIWIKRHRDTEIRNRHRSLERKRADTPIGERLKAALLADDLYRSVDRAVAAGLDRGHREDIVADIIEAVLNGEIERDQIESVAREFATSHFRSFTSLKVVSLDAQVYGDNDLALIDMVSTSDWTFEGAI